MAAKFLSFESKSQDRFIREPERVRITGLSRSAWYKLEREGKVPKRIQLGPRTVGWKLSDIERWIGQFPNWHEDEIRNLKRDPEAYLDRRDLKTE